MRNRLERTDPFISTWRTLPTNLPKKILPGAICPCLLGAGAREEEVHTGWRHPRSMGDLVESVAKRLFVLDEDLDVIVEAYPGNLDDTQFASNWGLVSVGYIRREAWSEALLLSGQTPIAHTKPSGLSSKVGEQYTSDSWPYWLIETREHDSYSLINEARKLLGLEK